MSDQAPPVPTVALPEPYLDLALSHLNSVGQLRTALRALRLLATAHRPWFTLNELAAVSVDTDNEQLEEHLGAAVEAGILAGTRVIMSSGPTVAWTTPDQVQAVTAGGWDNFALLDLEPPVTLAAQPNVFAIYEDNIGVLTAAVADRLRDAEDTYPAQWIADAITEAALHNARSWAYIEAILRRWAEEGRDGEPETDSGTVPDAVQRLGGRYRHLFNRTD